MTGKDLGYGVHTVRQGTFLGIRKKTVWRLGGGKALRNRDKEELQMLEVTSSCWEFILLL